MALLEKTAWRTDPPPMYGAFHLIALAAVTAAAFWLARRLSAQTSRGIRILAVTGWLLILLEIYKQLFLYYIVNGGAYDWWYFPFQLCSVPMYLCVLLPAVRGRLRDAFLTFMATFTLLSGTAALLFPEDFLRSYVSLTLHGFIWHGALIFIALFILFSRMADLSLRGYARAVFLFALMCIIAVSINIAVEPLANAAHASDGVPGSYAAMFYLSPYHISSQPIVSTVQAGLGIPAGLVLYAAAIAAAGGVICAGLGRFSRKDR